MGERSPINNGVSWVYRVAERIVSSFTALVRHKLFAYIVVTLVLAIGVGGWDHHQRNLLVQKERQANRALRLNQYENCQDLESVKRQANERIRLLKVAQKAVIFKTPEIAHKLAEQVDKVHPLPKVDCTPLLPGN